MSRTKKSPKSKKVSVAKAAAAKSTNGNGAAPHGRVIRVASVLNPKTKKQVLVGVRTDGVITDTRLIERLGVKGALKTWREVEADTWSQATAAFRAGKGTAVTR